MKCHSAGVVIQSKAEWGGHQEKNTDLQDVVNSSVSVQILFLPCLWATQAVLPRLGSSLQIWPLVD